MMEAASEGGGMERGMADNVDETTSNSGSMQTYNDRALNAPDGKSLPKPQIEIIVDGNTVFKPGMKTYYIKDSESRNTQVMGEYCSCDTVCTCNTVCTCESVCTCQTVCGCVSYTIPTGPKTPTVPNTPSKPGTTCTCQSVSCGSPCACVPVH